MPLGYIKVQNSKGKNALGLSTAVSEAVIQLKEDEQRGIALQEALGFIFFLLLPFQLYH